MLRRRFLGQIAGSFLCIVTVVSPTVALARRGRLRLRGGVAGRGRRAYDAETLTPDELRGCLQQEEQISAIEEAFDSEVASFEALEREIAQLDQNLSTREVTLNVYDKGDVDAFNQMVVRRNALVDRYQMIYDSRIRIAQDELHRRHETFNDNCANKRYFEEDLNEIRQQ